MRFVDPRLFTTATTVLDVPAPPADEYQPQLGDVLVLAVLRPTGVLVTGPNGWTLLDTMRDAVDPDQPEHVGDVTFWHQVQRTGDEHRPRLHLHQAVWAKVLLQVWRPGWECGPRDPIDGLGMVGQWPTEWQQ